MRQQLKRSVQHVHLEAVPNRPRTPPQPLWQGPAPSGVDAVLPRAALDKPYIDFFAEWASNLALLRSDFVEQIYQDEVARMRQQFKGITWDRYKVLDLDQCDVGPHSLWIKKQVAGWSVELRYPCDVDARVLTITSMPILCPDELSAARLALACYPEPAAGLLWRSYT
ncbi:hypothetical protein QA639_04685 [Bradyrhizobium pachyrhizi]|uniref:hypothetical protein n=1 Tax=Bradyrhizobium pachyrhizi TaxID=280333 RepID=UPI0024B04371|nr:hypothetical protein [Bradyrhizobium pachyrhizi]WFU56828.1 hypothetical protein QA639_04685 [Bradyrhizobium pachyrhizi]